MKSPSLNVQYLNNNLHIELLIRDPAPAVVVQDTPEVPAY